MLKITTKALSEHFDRFKGYISNPPEQQVLEWVFHYIQKSYYHLILSKFGIGYLLIILDFLEKKEEYEECSKVLVLINFYNEKSKKKLPKHISQLKSIY